MPRTTIFFTIALLALLGAVSSEASAAEYRKLGQVGVQARSASISGQQLTVTVRARQRTSLKLEVMTSRRVVARARTKVVKKGRRRVVVRLDRRLTGGALRLRVTVKNLKTRKRGRGFIPVKLIAGPGPTPPPTPTPTPGVNRAPTGIGVAEASVAENLPAGTRAGTLTAVDADAGDVHRFTLVAGAGDADNALFVVDGAQLRTAAPLDFEQQATRSVRVRVDDGKGGVLEKALTIAVTDANDAPTAPKLSAQTVSESAPPGTVVGVLEATDQDAGQTLTFALVSGPGDADNASFVIDGSALKTETALDFETRSAYTVRVQADDGNGGTTADQFSIVVTDATEGLQVAMTGTPLAYTENGAPVAVDPALTATAPEGMSVTGATARISAGFGPGDTLGFTSQSGITGSYNPGTGVLTLSGTASPATYQQALRSLTYSSTSDAPAAGKAIEIVLHDGAASSPPATRPVAVATVNDPPVADADSFGGGQRGVRMRVGSTHADAHEVEVAGNVLAGDTDVDTPSANLSATPGTITTADGGTVTLASDGSFTYDPPAGDDGSDSFTYTVEDNDTGDSDGTEDTHTATVTITQVGPRVWFVDDSAPAGGRGVSHAPLQSLAPLATGGTHDALDGTTDHVFVHSGSYASGIALEAAQKLVGQPAGLLVGGRQLVAAGGTKPVITSASGDVVELASGNDVRGIAVDPQGAGGGIFGGAGDVGGTIDDVAIVDTVGSNGSGPGLELNGTGGDFAITNLSVTNNATGVLLNANAGKTDFGTTTITSNGAPGLSAAQTNMDSSTFDAITVTNSATGGVLLSNLSGAINLGDGIGSDLGLTTTSGTTPAFKADSVTGLVVGAAGTDNVSATGGPAVDVVNAAGALLDFDQVQSTNSASDGVNLDGLTTGSFAAGATSAVTGAAGQAFDLNGGSGAVSFQGTLGNGSGGTAEITNRSGGAVTFGGAINDTADAGGGIALSANSGGSTTFGGATKTLNTGAAPAVSFTGSDGHTLSFTGGGLDIDTTTADGIVAATAGTISVTGSGNTVQTASGRAVNVETTDIGSGGFFFRSIGTSGGAATGIRLDRTGDVAGMTITGDGTDNSGGTINNTTGPGISLAHTRSFAADELSITNTNAAGVDGTEVTNFSFTDGQILNAGDGRTDNMHAAIAFNDTAAANENNVDGVLTITGNLLKDHYGGGIDVFNFAGTITEATVSSNVIDSLADLTNSREDAISFNLFGTASTVASLTKATIASNAITDHPNGHGIVVMGSQPNTGGPAPAIGTPGNVTNRVHINANSIVGDPVLGLGGAGVQVGVEGRGVGNYHVTDNNPVNNVGTHGITGGNSGSSSVDYTFTGNTVTANNQELGAIGVRMANDKHIMVGGSTLSNPVTRARIESNTVRNTTGSGMRVLQGNSNGAMNAIVNGNNIAGGGSGTPGLRVENGSSNDAAWDPTMCATITNNTIAANGPTSGGHTFPGIALFKRTQNTAAPSATSYDFGIVGLTPSPSTAANTESYVAGLNPNSNLGANFYAGKRVTVDAGGNFFTSCTMPAGF